MCSPILWVLSSYHYNDLSLSDTSFMLTTSVKTSRYDWNALKLKFFASRHESIRGFLEEEIGMKENWNSRKMTLGWSEERENFRRDIYEQAKEKLGEELSETVYAPSIVELGEMHKEIIEMLKLSLSHIKSSCLSVVDGKEVITQTPDTQEITRIWKIIRIESQQATDSAKEIESYRPTMEDLIDD